LEVGLTARVREQLKDDLMLEQVTPSNYLELAAEIVSAYVANNSVPQSELASLLGVVHGALDRTARGVAAEVPQALTPAVPIKKSVTPDYVVCLDVARSSSR
jgi:predicted transcriptional regulator